MTTFFNTVLTGPIYIGSQKTKLNVLYDTGVASTSVGITACGAKCLGTKFDTKTSTTFFELPTPLEN